ncbi:hypothetical protein B0H63DRAFT_297981 [Podospora didyma]|uniref:Uncharacterized protein n=1 Tax=Podospora didyma TaxID=330526 RepID=A0AAE0K963_9PEZI|nr:hypothetical protein B0H63DRAFT_297981 [Podospora didyma]
MLAHPVAQNLEMDGIGMDHRFHHHQQLGLPPPTPQVLRRKRKADAPPDNNERLSKRLSLLNLEQSGQKLYVPVENSQVQSASPSAITAGYSSSPRNSNLLRHASSAEDDSVMQLDDTKHKVYIYNLEDELSSESEAEDANSKLVFLSDIEKHMRSNRILPDHILNSCHRPNAADLAGKELVLYRVPSSITVPEEQDNVRKAILEARARLREKLKAELQNSPAIGSLAGSQAVPHFPQMTNGFFPTDVPAIDPLAPPQEEDADAMELD